MEGITSYNKDFTKKMAPPATQIRDDGQKLQGGKFEGEPTYKDAYKKWDMCGRHGPFISKDPWVQPIARFEGETTMNHDYRKYAQPPRQSMKPQEETKLSDAPFSDNTGYRQSYQPHALGPKFVREREQYKAPGVPFGGVSTFKRDYRGSVGELTKSFKPNNPAFSSGQPLEDLTTNRKDYIKHAEPPRQSIKPQEETKLSDAPFADNTGYRQSYQPHALGTKFVREREQYKAPGVPFGGVSTFKRDYRGSVGELTKSFKPNNPAFSSGQPLEDLTTNRKDYIKHAEPPRQSIKPQEETKLSDAPFADNTGYRQSYQPHALGTKFVREREQYKAPGVPFDGVTTFKRDYRGPIGELTKSFKPDNQAFSSGQPLEDLTNNRKDYIKYPASKPYVHVQEGYKKPEGDMFMQTTNKSTYRQLPLDRNAMIRPTDAGKVSNGPFDGTTSYSLNYKKWQVKAVEQSARERYHLNNAPFEGMSTQKAHFIPHEMVANRSFKPDNTAFQSYANTM
ncbi:stabilizer of axonemal microtubules 2-like [Mytilus californianus]|uniref:stabilizer of axonemal microtubules 2-like n=1 Tax=Mytilus californianus TaxID=6549 RepID=UPI002246F17E|nr:stabilizer of axonemal microtubules 2-like [Mytilus californianus]